MDSHTIGIEEHSTFVHLLNELMGHIPFTFWLPMFPGAAPALTNINPSPIPPTTTTDSAMLHNNSRLHTSLVQPPMQAAVQTAAEAARRRQEEEDASIRLVQLLITCTGAIQAGDYSVAHGNLTEARVILKKIPTSIGIGRVGIHFADALAQRLFPEYPHAALPTPPPTTPAAYNHFYEAGPYLKFAHSTANRAILKAFEGCKRVHIIDFTLMQGLQWPLLMDELSKREGGPPEILRITGIGLNPTSGRDELHEVGVHLSDIACRMKIPFTFKGVCADHLDHLSDWIHLKPIGDEALAINSILQLHHLLVDPDADPTVPAPINVLLKLVMKLKPNIFTVVEQEADHNKPMLLERFTNALFHYATMFDSLEACPAASAVGTGSTSTTTSSSQLTEAYLRGEIFDIICNEGSSRIERHELFSGGWKERLTGAGLTQVEFDLSEANMAIADLIKATSFFGSGFSILQCSGSLALAWHGRPLYVATAWHAIGGNAAASASSAAMAHTKGADNYHKGWNGSGGGEGNRGHRGVAGGITFM